MKSIFTLLVLVLIVVVLAIIFVPRLFASEEKKVEKTIDAVEKAVKTKDYDKTLEYISEEYTDSFHHDLKSFRKDLKRLFDNSGVLYIKKSNLDIEIDKSGTTATVFFIAEVSTGFGKNRFDLIEEFAKSNRFLVHLRKSNGQWKITSVENSPYSYD